MSPAEEPSNEIILYRLRALEEHVGRLEDAQRQFVVRVEEGWKAFSERVDQKFSDMTVTMQNLAYVPRGEHVITHDALEQRMTSAANEAKAKAEGADRHAWWAIALIATSVMGAIITATLQAAF